jgi:hypothetical protein
MHVSRRSRVALSFAADSNIVRQHGSDFRVTIGNKLRFLLLLPAVTFAVIMGGGIASTVLPVAQAQAPKAAPPAQAPKQQPAPQPQAPRPAQIDRNGVLILIRSTLLALDQANKTGNYTVLRDLGSPDFQVNSAARLAEIFAQERRDNVDLSGVAVIDPQLTLLPQIEANGMMRMTGFFPSVPTQVNFELIYAPVNGRWKLRRQHVQPGARQHPCRPPLHPAYAQREPDHPRPQQDRAQVPVRRFHSFVLDRFGHRLHPAGGVSSTAR